MKAAILEKLDSPLTVRDVELTELQFGQVLVKVSVSGICGAQLQEIHGYKNNAKFLPHLIGHEGCGTVEKVGPGVTRVKIGEKVSMHWRQGLGIESDFPKYLLDGKVISSGKLTTLSEYTISSENRLTAIPADTPDELGALLGCGLSTALGVIDNEAEIKFGESIAIIGCGGVGLNLIQAARMKSCSRLIGIDQVDNKSELAKSLGATHFLSTSRPEFLEDLKQANDGRMIDVIIDTTGSSELISSVVPLLSDFGRLIMVGQPKPGERLSFLADSSFFGTQGKLIKSTQGGKTFPSTDILRYIDLYKSGFLDFEKVITHRFKLPDINDAFSLLKSGTAGRIIIEMDA